MKTIKQIASEIGVSKPAVRKKIEKLGLSDMLEINGNKFLINEECETLIKSAFFRNESETHLETNAKTANHESEKNENLVSDLIAMLQKELETKNQQIEKLQDENARLLSALENATASINASQALHAGTIQTQLIESQKPEQPEQQQPSFWARLFKSKK